MRSVVVTGVSSGIGRATAELLIARGYRVFGSVRKTADADALQQQLGAHFIPLLFDITDEFAVNAAARQVQAEMGDETLAGLVNNAGVAMAGPLTHLPVEDFRQQLEINLVAPMRLTQIFLPLLGTDDSLRGVKGRIVNISSNSGRIAMPFLGPYCASKHGFEGWSASLRRELMFYGIDVVTIGPGPIATEIWDKAEQMDIAPYEQLEIAPALRNFRDYAISRGRAAIPPSRVATQVFKALTLPSPKARYTVVGKPLLDWTLPRLLPARWLGRLVAGNLGLKRRR